MKLAVGTKSILFGAHQFVIHPLMVALAWWKFYGFPWDPRLWVVFIIHDWGYWGKPNMDGPEGEIHPWWAASLAGTWWGIGWYYFCLFHSRYLASRQKNMRVSTLCVADKYAFCLTPKWLYLPLVRWTGEADEYMQVGKVRGPEFEHVDPFEYDEWYDKTWRYLYKWCHENVDKATHYHKVYEL